MQHLASIKPTIAVQIPVRYSFIEDKISKNFARKQSRERLARSNQKILASLEAIHSRLPVTSKPAKTSDSARLNLLRTRKRRAKHEAKIAAENAVMARRLVSLKSTYPVQELRKERKKQERVLQLRHTDHAAGYLCDGSVCSSSQQSDRRRWFPRNPLDDAFTYSVASKETLDPELQISLSLRAGGLYLSEHHAFASASPSPLQRNCTRNGKKSHASRKKRAEVLRAPAVVILEDSKGGNDIAPLLPVGLRCNSSPNVLLLPEDSMQKHNANGNGDSCVNLPLHIQRVDFSEDGCYSAELEFPHAASKDDAVSLGEGGYEKLLIQATKPLQISERNAIRTAICFIRITEVNGRFRPKSLLRIEVIHNRVTAASDIVAVGQAWALVGCPSPMTAAGRETHLEECFREMDAQAKRPWWENVRQSLDALPLGILTTRMGDEAQSELPSIHLDPAICATLSALEAYLMQLFLQEESGSGQLTFRVRRDRALNLLLESKILDLKRSHAIKLLTSPDIHGSYANYRRLIDRFLRVVESLLAMYSLPDEQAKVSRNQLDVTALQLSPIKKDMQKAFGGKLGFPPTASRFAAYIKTLPTAGVSSAVATALWESAHQKKSWLTSDEMAEYCSSTLVHLLDDNTQKAIVTTALNTSDNERAEGDSAVKDMGPVIAQKLVRQARISQGVHGFELSFVAEFINPTRQQEMDSSSQKLQFSEVLELPAFADREEGGGNQTHTCRVEIVYEKTKGKAIITLDGHSGVPALTIAAPRLVWVDRAACRTFEQALVRNLVVETDVAANITALRLAQDALNS